MDLKKVGKSDFQLRLDVLRELLRDGDSRTQEDLCEALRKKRFDVTQSTVSRDLRKVGAVKTTDSNGQTIYRLPEEMHIRPPTVSHNLGGLLIDIEANESMIVLHTSPGSASLVARHLDSMRSSLDILGTIAGDDTIFIAPTSSRLIKSIIKRIYDVM
jgi:transcriptional regulator of arginine metabolism